MSKVQHWSKMQERGTYVGMRFLLFVYKILGRGILSFFLYPVVVYIYFSGGASKKASLEYFKRIALINKSPKKVNHRIGIKHFYTFAQSAFDKVDAWSGKIPPENIIYDGEHPLAALKARNQGAIFIGSHLGNLEVCRALGSGRYETKINVLVFTHHAVEFNKVIEKINPNSNVDLIQVTEVTAALAILLKDKIDNGEIIVIAGDRTSASTPGRVINCDFLGDQAPFGQGAFILASILECPVYFLFCLKEGKSFRIIFHHVAEQLKLNRKTRQEDLYKIVSLYVKKLECYCLQYPFQWFNFFDFWQNDTSISRPNIDKKNVE